MATGAAPALDPNQENKPATQVEAQAKRATLMERIANKLLRIFEHNERLGVTRP
jgi:hypothetical protein